MWPSSIERPEHARSALRFALGVTLASVLSVLGKQLIPMLLPLLLAQLLKPGSKPLSLKLATLLVLLVSLGFLAGTLVNHVTAIVPSARMLVLGWLVYGCYYAAARGVSSVVTTLALFGLLVVPVVGQGSAQIGFQLVPAAGSLILSAVVCTQVAFLAFPPRPGEAEMLDEGASAAPAVTSLEAHRTALRVLLIVFPVIAAGVLAGAAGYLTGMIYLALWGLDASVARVAHKERNWMQATLVGGGVALPLALLVHVGGSVAFSTVAFFATALYFGRWMASNAHQRSMASSAFTAVVLIVSSEDAQGKLLSRLLQITAVILFATIVTSALGSAGPRKEPA